MVINEKVIVTLSCVMIMMMVAITKIAMVPWWLKIQDHNVFVHFPVDGNGCGEIPCCLQTPPLQNGNIIIMLIIMVMTMQTLPL